MPRLLLWAIVCACCTLPTASTNAQPRFNSPAAPYYYLQTTYHRQVQLLEQQIRVRKAEIAALERQLDAWEPFDRFRNGRPLMVTIENSSLILMEAKLDLARLEQDLFALVHSRAYR